MMTDYIHDYDDCEVEVKLPAKAVPAPIKTGRRKSSDNPEQAARVERYAAIVAAGGTLFEERS